MHTFIPFCLVVSLAAACGSSDSPSSTAGSPGAGGSTSAGAGGSSAAGSSGAGGTSTAGTSATGGTGATGGTSAAGGGAGTSAGGSGAGGFPTQFGSYVVLGDSISDMGPVPNHEPPYFYDLLYQNDDAAYPQWAGLDLKTKYGVATYQHAAKAGAVALDVYSQVKSLPKDLPGPVLVTVTIGGNDIQGAAIDILQKHDQMDRDKFRLQMDNYLAALQTQLAGAEIYVLQANIYDPSDGAGDFGMAMCPPPLGLLPMMPTDPIFGTWNAIVDDEVPKYDHGVVAPLHDAFHGHGVSAGADRWFLGDCIHPTKPGHQGLRRMFWKSLTGKDGPA